MIDAGAGSAPAAALQAAGAPVPVLDQLVERAMGKSTRQVQQMLAEVDPEAAAPASGCGATGLKAVIDAECQRGLQQLRELLSHVDPNGRATGGAAGAGGSGALRPEPTPAPEAEVRSCR